MDEDTIGKARVTAHGWELYTGTNTVEIWMGDPGRPIVLVDGECWVKPLDDPEVPCLVWTVDLENGEIMSGPFGSRKLADECCRGRQVANSVVKARRVHRPMGPTPRSQAREQWERDQETCDALQALRADHDTDRSDYEEFGHDAAERWPDALAERRRLNDRAVYLEAALVNVSAVASARKDVLQAAQKAEKSQRYRAERLKQENAKLRRLVEQRNELPNYCDRCMNSKLELRGLRLVCPDCAFVGHDGAEED